MTVTPGALTATVVANMRRLRKARGWSAQRLTEAVTAAGIAWDRSIVANLENGRRSTVSVDELAALARVLDVEPPWSLTETPICATCAGTPPTGFTCRSCGASA